MTAHWDADPTHGEDFWKLGDWDNLHAGQMVAAVWPSGARIGKLDDGGAGTLYLTLNDHGNVSSVEGLKRDGAALFVEAKPAIQLPTANGFYVDASGDAWRLWGGGWYALGDGSLWVPWKASELATIKDLPLTRLSPEADTARRVLERVRAVGSLGNHREPDLFLSQINAMAWEFGVQS